MILKGATRCWTWKFKIFSHICQAVWSHQDLRIDSIFRVIVGDSDGKWAFVKSTMLFSRESTYFQKKRLKERREEKSLLFQTYCMQICHMELIYTVLVFWMVVINRFCFIVIAFLITPKSRGFLRLREACLLFVSCFYVFIKWISWFSYFVEESRQGENMNQR